MPVLVVEEDRVLRQVGLLLDPATSAERTAAFLDYYAHDVEDFIAWREAVRAKLAGLYPSEVRIYSNQEELREYLPAADVLIAERFAIGERELERAPRLRVVQQFGSIVDNIDTRACRSRSLPLLTIRRRTNVACAEHTLMLILALAKKLPLTNGLVTDERLQARGFPPRPFDTRHVARANFGRIPGIGTLLGRTLGLLGQGEIGREVARFARVLGMRVLYHKRRRLDAEKERETGVEYCGFHELFERSDLVSLHVPLNSATRGLVDAATLRRMKRGAFLINISRASIVDRAALVDAVESGHLGGVGLDVLYREPTTPDDPLLHHENVIVTPHIAGASRMNSLMDIEEMLIGIARALSRRPSQPDE